MALYKTGTLAVNTAGAATGTGTSWTAAATGIRNGQTVLINTNPAQQFTIQAINSATSLTLSPTPASAIPAGTTYAILVTDALSVDGLGSQVAEAITYFKNTLTARAASGDNTDITSLGGLTNPLSIAQGGTGSKSPFGITGNTFAQGNDARLNTIDGKSGGKITTTAQLDGGATINLANGLVLQGKVQNGSSANNNISVISGDGSTGTGGYAGGFVYNWYADGWITGVTRGSGTNTLAYSIYYNGASAGNNGKTWNFNFDGTATGAGAWTNGSDARHKSKIKEVENALSAVCSWRGCSYEIKDGGEAVGLIAQDVEKFCPVAIKSYGDREFSDNSVVKDFKYLDTTGVSAAYHTEAIKQLFALLELALEDPDACRAKIEAVKGAMIDVSQAEQAS